MSKRLDIRLDDDTLYNLDLLVEKTGKSKTEIMKDLINNARASDFQMVAKTKKDINREIQMIATRKTLIWLYKNATTNLNQIARDLNIDEKGRREKEKQKRKEKQIKDLKLRFNGAYAEKLLNSFSDMKSSLDILTKEVKKLAGKDD